MKLDIKFQPVGEKKSVNLPKAHQIVSKLIQFNCATAYSTIQQLHHWSRDCVQQTLIFKIQCCSSASSLSFQHCEWLLQNQEKFCGARTATTIVPLLFYKVDFLSWLFYVITPFTMCLLLLCLHAVPVISSSFLQSIRCLHRLMHFCWRIFHFNTVWISTRLNFAEGRESKVNDDDIENERKKPTPVTEMSEESKIVVGTGNNEFLFILTFSKEMIWNW